MSASADSADKTSDRGYRWMVAACLLLTGVLLFISPKHWLINDPYGDARRIAQVAGTILTVFSLVVAFRRSVGNAVPVAMGAVESGLVMMALGGGIGVVGWLLMQQKSSIHLGLAALIGAGFVFLIGFGRLAFGARRS